VPIAANGMARRAIAPQNGVKAIGTGGEAMPRVSEIEEDGGDVFGGLLNTTKVFAHCPPILRAAKLLGASIEQSGQLPKELPPLVYLRVASINGCPF
jgi:alkylhydroperoxidase family enzyme